MSQTERTQKMIYLEKAVVEQIPITALPVYISMRMMMHQNQTEDYYTAGRICYTLKLPFSKYWHDETKIGIEWLIIKERIAIKEKDPVDHGYIFDVSNLNLPQGGFFIMIDEKDLFRITTSDLQNAKKLTMIKLYVTLIGSFNHSRDLGIYKGKVSTVSIKYLAEQLGVAEKTIMRDIKWLEENGLIYVHRSNDFVKTYDGLKQITNVYSKPEDRQICDEYALEYEKNYGYKTKSVKSHKTKTQADNNRSLAQKYIQMTKGKEYDQKTTEEVRRYVENMNAKWQKEVDFFEEMGNQEESVAYFKSMIRDMSVFN